MKSDLPAQQVDSAREASKLYTGLPVPNGSTSFWMGQARQSQLLGIQSPLPSEADLVIIGSGFTAAATAYWLFTSDLPNAPKKVIMLDAREVCSGATGRNGGFCRPDMYRGYSGYKKAFGKEQALRLLEQEWETFQLTEEVIKKEGIQCDWHKSTTMDIAMDPVCAEEMRALLDEYTADGGKNAQLIQFSSDLEQVRERTRTPEALAYSEVPCASLWPYKLVTHLLQLCLDKGLSLQSNTPATAIKQESEGLWTVETPRGSIKSPKILHATNAFAPTLLPELEGYLAPVRGQAARIVPPLTYSGKNMLQRSLMFRNAEKSTDYDYLNQRVADGSIICGGGRITIPIQDMVGHTDDSGIQERTQDYVKTLGQKYMAGWGEEGHGEGLIQSWSGIMSYTHHMIPLVGAVPGRQGQFICAGHSGHGMARIMGISRGLAKLLTGGAWTETGLPECFQMSEERLTGGQSVQEEFWTGKKGWTLPSKE